MSDIAYLKTQLGIHPGFPKKVRILPRILRLPLLPPTSNTCYGRTDETCSTDSR